MPRRSKRSKRSCSGGKRSCSGGKRSCSGGKRRRGRSLKRMHPVQQAMAMAQGQSQAQAQGQGQSGGGLAPLGYSVVGADMSQGGAGAYEINTVGGKYDQQAGYFDNAYKQSGAYASTQSGGRRRRRRKGGNFGSVVGNAVVPFALLGAQNAFGRRRMSKLMHSPQRLVRGTRRALKFGGNAEKW